MYRRILVPLDGSEAAERALPLARILSVRHGAEVHLVHVLTDLPDYSHKVPQDDLAWGEEAGERAAEYLEGLVEGLRQDGPDRVTGEVVRGVVPEALEEYRAAHGIDLVVMTTHGEGGFRRWWLGSVADRLIRRIPVPLLLLRPWEETGDLLPGRERFEHAVVPLDGSEEAEEALPHARTLASTFDARLTLLQVIPPGLWFGRFHGAPVVSITPGLVAEAREEAREYLEGVAASFRDEGDGEGVPVEVAVAADEQPAEGILSGVREGEADLIVLATHGRGGFTRFVVGSVADKVIRGSVTPVLVVRVSLEE